MGDADRSRRASIDRVDAGPIVRARDRRRRPEEVRREITVKRTEKPSKNLGHSLLQKILSVILHEMIMERRRFLKRVSPSIVICSAGCMLLSESANDSDTVRLRNRTEQKLTGEITLLKFDEDSDAADTYAKNPDSPDKVIRRKVWEFEVEGNSVETNDGMITEPGAYYIEVACERGEVASGEAGLYSAGPNGDGIGGGQIVITLNDDNDSPQISIGQEVLD